MPKKHKLDSGLSYSYSIIGISTPLKDYNLVFHLNRVLSLSFRRIKDFHHEEQKPADYSFYFFRNPDERRNYMLIANRCPDGFLIPSLKTIDYFLITDETLQPAKSQLIIKQIQSAPSILTVVKIDTSRIKNIDLLIAEIELHVIETKATKMQ